MYQWTAQLIVHAHVNGARRPYCGAGGFQRHVKSTVVEPGGAAFFPCLLPHPHSHVPVRVTARSSVRLMAVPKSARRSVQSSASSKFCGWN